MDESGFSLRPSVRRTWAPKGQTPHIKHHFNWKRLHAVGAIACRPNGSSPRLHLQVQHTTADAESSMAFLESLRAEFAFAGPVLVLWDGLPAHRSKTVKTYIEQQKSWLTVERLPAYAPELNPVEYLWASMKTKHTPNVCDNTVEGLEQRIEKAYHRYCSEPEVLSGCLKASKLYSEKAEQLS